MAGRSIVVDRRKKLGWAASLYLPSLLRSLRVSARHFAGSLRRMGKGRGRSAFVVRYPEERIDYPDAFRGMPVLVAREDGSPRCVSCGQCAVACPASCIRIVPEARAANLVSAERSSLEGACERRPPERFDIDMSRCIFCGFCEDACPEEAIVMSRLVELATDDPEALHYDLEALLVPAELLSRRLAFLRREAGAGESRTGLGS
jgi:NADH-quinone oxidoreductase subunit I